MLVPDNWAAGQTPQWDDDNPDNGFEIYNRSLILGVSSPDAEALLARVRAYCSAAAAGTEGVPPLTPEVLAPVAHALVKLIQVYTTKCMIMI
jgi:hypothetical protein